MNTTAEKLAGDFDALCKALQAEANKAGDDTHADLMREAAEALSTPAVPDVSDLLALAVECGVIRMSKVMDTDLQDALQKFANRLLASALSTPAVPAGHVLVPVEPTAEMLGAACDAEARPLTLWQRMEAVYSAMLAAAGRAQQEGRTDG
jgi:hypothetical protein